MDWSQGCPRCSSIVTTIFPHDPDDRPYAALLALSSFYAVCRGCGYRAWNLEHREWFDDLDALTARCHEIVADRGITLWPPPIPPCSQSTRKIGSWADRPAELDPAEEWKWNGEKVTHACGSDDVLVTSVYPGHKWLPEVKVWETHVMCRACDASDCLPGIPFGDYQNPRFSRPTASFRRKSEQARRVSAHTTGGGSEDVFLKIINASGLVVTHFEAVAIAAGYPGAGAQWRGSFYPPGTVFVVEPGVWKGRYVEPPTAGLTFRLEIVFTDDNGVRWHKYGSEGLHEVPRGFTLLDDLDWDPSKSPPKQHWNTPS
jgi:hypothetical protein